MAIKLNILDHQNDFLRSIIKTFDGVDIKGSNQAYENPIINMKDPKLKENISEIWKGEIGNKAIPHEWRLSEETSYLGLDIRMETGTGKTYCYTRMMYELNRLYGFHKFIVLVPTTPIREGARSFIEADYAIRHFADLYPNKKLDLNVLEAQKTKKGKKFFPGAVSEFARGSSLAKNRFSVLLMGQGMLNSDATMNKDYDETVLGNITKPYKALKKVRPIVIIDEPHRFKKDSKSFKKIIKEINPQCIIRFGATFPSIKKKKDFNNLIFNLGPGQAFNQNLVKGVETFMIEQEESNENKIKLLDFKRKPKFAKIRNEKTMVTDEFRMGDSLSILGEEFAGISIEEIGKTSDDDIKTGVTLSNGQILSKGDIIYGGTYSQSYQELMIRQSIKNHFKAEKENFLRSNKIKTLSLYFIDSVYSYRSEDEQDGPLRLLFQNLLEAHIKKEIESIKDYSNDRELEYKDYLQASLRDIRSTNGGYFSIDNSNTDEDIKKEVDRILKNKDYLLNFKDEDGSWNTLRFVFSKWTLKEGWDNPNIFQIVKIRSSGSDTSKLQEVGRGLRLPVDENGQRISDEQFYLKYMIDYSEKDFANSLIREINNDQPDTITNIKEILPKLSKIHGKSEDEIFGEMLAKKYIDYNGNIKEEFIGDIYQAYPEIITNLHSNKVLDGNKKKNRVKIKKDKFEKIRNLWEKVNQKYYLKIDDIDDDELKNTFISILSRDIYRDDKVNIIRHYTDKNEDGKTVLRETVEDYFIVDNTLSYSDFLKSINKQVGLPIKLIHESLCEYSKENKIDGRLFSQSSINIISNEFHKWLDEVLLKKFSYKMLDIDVKETSLTDQDGNVKDELVQGVLGVYRDDNTDVPEKFIYDSIIFDSDKEKENIVNGGISKVTVFGKIPRKSIQIPLFTGGTTSPDFMYLVESEDGNSEINFIVETKDMTDERSLRRDEEIRIASAKKFFETMKKDGVNVVFKKQLKNDDIVAMINELKC